MGMGVNTPGQDQKPSGVNCPRAILYDKVVANFSKTYGSQVGMFVFTSHITARIMQSRNLDAFITLF